jgi:hypothetical protein
VSAEWRVVEVHHADTGKARDAATWLVDGRRFISFLGGTYHASDTGEVLDATEAPTGWRWRPKDTTATTE